MKAQKLPSGNWRVQVSFGKGPDGKTIRKSVTAKTKQEAIRQAALLTPSEDDLTVKEACEGFLEIRGPELSPATLRGYGGIYRQHIENDVIGCYTLRKLATPAVQKWISKMKVSSKTKHNALGFLKTVVSFYAPEKTFRVKILDTEKEELYTPTMEEVNRVLALADPELRKAILLGIFGLRRGEICALTAEDLDRSRCLVRISKDVVKTDKTLGGGWVTKAPKTKKSVRWVSVTPAVMEQLPDAGPVVDISPDVLTNRFRKLVERAGVPHFRFHDLRSFFASISVSSAIGASELTVQDFGGWATNNVLKRHYERSISDQKRKDTAAIVAYFDEHLSI